MKKKVLNIVLFLLICVISFSQESLEQLKASREKNRRDLEYANKILKQTKAEKSLTLNNLRVTNKRLKLRDDFIYNTKKEINAIQSIIDSNEIKISNYNKELDKAKNEYARVIYETYKRQGKYNLVMFILSAENFNQAYKRIKYIQQLINYRTEQIVRINTISEKLELLNNELEEKRLNKENLLNMTKEEREVLAFEKSKKDKLVKHLRSKEKELVNEIKEKERIANKIVAEIRKVIEEENRKNQGLNKLTPQERIISNDFIKNKGRLPWPTAKGIVTEKFGEHNHPIFGKDVKIQNNGIDILTVKNSTVRAIFEGEVTKIISILGANYTVIIRHGNFLTVYQNLVNVKVKAGDKVKTKAEIGIVAENSSNESIIHIEIWKEYEKLNPEDWLSKY